jgi:hypothetical protein
MAEDVIGDHLERVRTAVLTRDTAASIAGWITRNTTYAGQPYSYHDHEFQERIMSDISRDVVVIKCSQVGMSEVGSRMSLALVNVLRPYTVAYTLPTAKFAGTFAKTRIDPVIAGSKVMKQNIHTTNDNNEVKQFGDSFLYLRGAASANAPISIPVDHLVHDEVDFSDQEVLGQYQSRLTHSKWRRSTKISTPTLPMFGIHRAYQETRRYVNLCKCNHCNHWFQPDYYDHVRIPGFVGDLSTINKTMLRKLRFQDAQLHCPSCGLVPSLQVSHREWVCENPTENYIGAGYQITPFDAPNIIQIPYLVEASTKYDRIQDFVNFNLGLAAEDKEATLSKEDFENVFCQFEKPLNTVNVMGVDVGNTYHFVIAAVDGAGEMAVLHREKVPMGLARKRYMELKKEFRVLCTVIDSMPHAETVMALQAVDVNLYASVYMKSKSVTTHAVVERAAEWEEGKDFIRQVNVNRSKALDGYMEFIREHHMIVRDQTDEDKEEFIAHHMSMKRVKVYDNESGEMQFSWQKTDGIDHFHHAGLYCWIASKIRGVGKSLIQLPLFSMYSFKNQTV